MSVDMKALNEYFEEKNHKEALYLEHLGKFDEAFELRKMTFEEWLETVDLEDFGGEL